MPTANRERCGDHARIGAEVFKERGARRVTECRGDDAPSATLTSFPMVVECAPDATLVFALVVRPDRATRDAGWKAMAEDPGMRPDRKPMPFAAMRPIYGGCEPVLDL